MVFYGIYNSDTLEIKIVNTVHNIHNKITWKEN